jgi:hypothetical protein
MKRILFRKRDSKLPELFPCHNNIQAVEMYHLSGSGDESDRRNYSLRYDATIMLIL